MPHWKALAEKLRVMAMIETLQPSIFNREDYDKLQREKRRLHDLLATYDKAENCGIDCAAYRGINASQMEALEKFEREFFTPPPK